MPKPKLNVESLQSEAKTFAQVECDHDEPSLYGTTDGKAVGTYLEHKFRASLGEHYLLGDGNSAKGIDFPCVNVDIKVTSIKQPQSSCPFKSAEQKILGLGYSLLIFVYEKVDNHEDQTSRLNIRHTVFIDESRTADYTMTRITREYIDRGASVEDLVAIFADRNLPVDEIAAESLAKKLIKQPPEQGYLTISNALQWRLQYKRAIDEAGKVNGILHIC